MLRLLESLVALSMYWPAITYYFIFSAKPKVKLITCQCLTSIIYILDMQLSRSQFQGHPFHLVTPSPWPLLTSFALLILTLAAAMYFNGFANGGTLVAIGFITTVSAMTLWFRDVVAEGTLLGNHTFAVQKGLNLGVALFIVSEVFFFISIFWALTRNGLLLI